MCAARQQHALERDHALLEQLLREQAALQPAPRWIGFPKHELHAERRPGEPAGHTEIATHVVDPPSQLGAVFPDPKRDDALVACAAERDRNTALLRQCDQLATEIAALRQGTAPPWKPALISEESRRLAHALATIRNMERSWFWRLRLAVVRFRGLAGSRRT